MRFEALFVKAMTRYTEAGGERLAQCLAAKSARDAVERLLRDAVMKFTSPEGPAVYFVTQGPLTRTDASEEAKRVMAQKRAVVELALLRRFDRAIEEGELPRATSSRDLAGFCSVMIQGIALQARHGGTTEDLLRVVDVGMACWPGKPSIKEPQGRGPMRDS
jgi:AcrR family transcriptional regulator